MRKNFGDARRTQIIDEGVELSIEDMIADEDVAITVTKNGYVKRTAVSTYQRQGRGGKGRSGAGTGKNEDWVEHLFIASTHSYLMIFTDDGQVFKLKVHEIPDALPSARGKAFVNLINIPSVRKLAGVMPVREFAEGRYVVMVTRKGVIKKTELSEFRNIRSNGINAVNVDDGDELLDVVLTDGTKRIFIATHDGLAIRFDESDVRPMGRTARGVRGIDLRKGDYVVSVAAVSAVDDEKMLSVSECGFGKQTPITTYRLAVARRQGRHQHEDDRQDRQGRRRLPRGRGVRVDDHHQAGQAHPHRGRRDTQDRPRRAGRAPHQDRRRRQGHLRLAARRRDAGGGSGGGRELTPREDGIPARGRDPSNVESCPRFYASQFLTVVTTRRYHAASLRSLSGRGG